MKPSNKGHRITRRLLIRPGAIGDCILSLPALEFLKAAYTEVWISSPVVPLVQFANRVRAISDTQLDLVGLGLNFPPNLAATLSTFDEIITWYGTNRPDFRTELSSIHPHVTFLNVLPDDSWQGHATDFFLHQVGAPPGLEPRIHLKPTPTRPAILIHPTSGSPKKNWPLENFKALANQLPLPVEWIHHQFESLLDLANWMQGASFYIGNDSGISHLAAAIGLPGLVLFGPTNPTLWRPRSSKIQIVSHELSVQKVLLEIEKAPHREAWGLSNLL